MIIPKFDMNELKVVGEMPSIIGGSGTPIYNFPLRPRDALISLYQGKAPWQIMTCMGVETTTFVSSIIPDSVARAMVFDGSFVPGVSNLSGGKDMFGIDWEYVPQAGGSMVRPGKPFIEDANEIKDKIVWPDIESWDWEGHKKLNEKYLETDNFVSYMFLNGFFERLISLMDFEEAIIALIDEEQKDAVKDFFDKLSDLYIRIFDKLITYFPRIDCFCIHDDWGAQKDTFFSPATAAEMIVPYMRKVTDFLHSKGKFCDLHSCGNLIKQVPNFIAAGWDSWTPQEMNDTGKIYELYGDQLLIGIMPDLYDPSVTTEEEQRALAREFANKFCRPDKPSTLNMYAGVNHSILTNAYREELYKQSRLIYA